jgi:hypothetical protein
MFVCIVMTSSEVTSHLKSKLVPGISSPRHVVSLITSFYPSMFLLIINDLHRLILMGQVTLV